MKIIFVGLEFEYYDPKRGHPQEYGHFYLTIKDFQDTEVIFYPIEQIIKLGRRKFNENLKALALREKPDLVFVFTFREEIDPKIMMEISKTVKTLAYFSDDHWRFDNYSKHYAKSFTYVCTTYSKAVEWYRRIGANVIHTQWGVNEKFFKPVFSGFPRKDFICDVSFVGQYHPQRARIIAAIRAAGIPLVVRGFGWPENPERISHEEMVKYFSLSKISLNLNPSSVVFGLKDFARLFLKRSNANKIVPDFYNVFNNIKSWHDKSIPQIKGRTFEVPACGGFLISGNADNLYDYYDFDKEIVIYNNIDELIGKIKYYLKYEKEREQIAKAGYERTIRDHTYKQRLKEIFQIAGVW